MLKNDPNNRFTVFRNRVGMRRDKDNRGIKV